MSKLADKIEAMELRDYFAAHAPSWWMSKRSNTVASAKIEMANRGLITREESKRYEFKPARHLWDQLDCLIAYEYADAMLRAREANR